MLIERIRVVNMKFNTVMIKKDKVTKQEENQLLTFGDKFFGCGKVGIEGNYIYLTNKIKNESK